MTTAKLPLLRWTITALAMYATGVFGLTLPHLGASMTLPLLPSGIAAAAMYRWGRRMWPAVLLGGFAIDLSLGSGLLFAILVAIGLVAGCLVFLRLLDRQQFDSRFGRARDVPVYVAAAGSGMAIAAAFGVIAHAFGGDPIPLAGYSAGLTWLSWWSNTSAGLLLLGPVLIGLDPRSLERFRGNLFAGGLWLLAVLGCGAIVLLTGDIVFRAPLLVAAMVVVVIGAIRYGLVVAGAAAFALTAVIAYSVAFNRGLLADVSQFHGHVLLWSSACALCGVNLIVASLLAERDAAARARERAEQRYSTIFNASPQPLWVHDPLTLRFLLVNDATVRQYGYSRAELLAATIDRLTATAGSRVLPGADDETGTDPFETRHRARDGRVLEVEVATSPIDFAGTTAVLVFAADVTERRALGRALIEAIGSEQRRIGQEMHDGLGQELTGLSLSAKALATSARREHLPVAGALDQLAELAGICIRSARDIVRGLSPLAEAGEDLEEALDALARRSSSADTKVSLHTRLDAALELELEARVHLYRIAQEALQNALKHARSSEVGIELWVQRNAVRLSVADNGRGVAGGAASGRGLGMRTMRFRTSAIGGRLRIEAAPAGGTRVVCEVPQGLALARVG